MSAPAVPKELGYHIQQPDAVAARSYRVCASPYNNQTFKSGDVIKIKLPTNRNSFFDPKKSYLKFVWTVPTNASGLNPGTLSASFDGYASVYRLLWNVDSSDTPLIRTKSIFRSR